ncbi:MAG: hypothetical protein AABX83_01525 [Nanoarchaeota archaeon]
MYRLFTANSKIEKRLKEYMASRNDIKNKLDELKKSIIIETVGTHKIY